MSTTQPIPHLRLGRLRRRPCPGLQHWQRRTRGARQVLQRPGQVLCRGSSLVKCGVCALGDGFRILPCALHGEVTDSFWLLRG